MEEKEREQLFSFSFLLGYVFCCRTSSACIGASSYQTWNWVIGSPGQWVIFHVRVTGSPGPLFDPVRPEFFRFSKKCPKCKTYI